VRITSVILAVHQCSGCAAQRPAFSRRLAALANATIIGAGTDSETQKSSDLARRKAVGWNFHDRAQSLLTRETACGWRFLRNAVLAGNAV